MKKSFIRLSLLGIGLIFPITLVILSTKEKRRHRQFNPAAEKPFVIVIPSYNNADYCEQNLLSVLNQRYRNFRVVYIDDASTDETVQKVKAIIERSPLKNQITLIERKQNQGSLSNLYDTIHQCRDDEIVVRVDGDDFLAHPFVLKKLNKVYADPDVWMTYGNYLDYPSYQQEPQLCQEFPKSILRNHRFRHYKWVTAHLHTFYAGLFKKISPHHLMKEGKFLPMAGDVAFMLPLLEMSAGHFRFIKEVLYLYNRKNPISDHIKNLPLQSAFEGYVRSLPSYQPLDNPPYPP